MDNSKKKKESKKKKIVSFCKEYKTELIVSGIIGGAFVLGFVTKGKIVKKVMSKKELVDMTGQSYISWFPKHGYLTYERALAAVEANKDIDCAYAIIKDAGKYIGIAMSKNVVLT